MKIYARWYPKTLAERAVWHFNFARQAAETGANYNLSAADIRQIAADAATVQYFNDTEAYLEAEMSNWRAARDAYLDGERGGAAPAMPEFAAAALPADALVAIAERTGRYAAKIEGADDYTESVGAAFGIVASAAQRSPDETAKPSAKITAVAEFKVSIKIPLKGMDGIQMQMERDGDPQRHKMNYPSGSIIDDTPPLAAGQSETRRYRFYYLRKNQIVGESSELYEVTVHA